MDSKQYSHFIDGERIYLREVRLSDVNENYYNWLADNEVSQFIETKFYPQSIESIKAYVESMRDAKNSVFLAILTKDTDTHIGNTKIGPINWIHRSADIAILLGNKESWGKGYGTEAIRMVSEYAFKKMNLHRLNAGIYENNSGSIKAFLKAGFKEEGIKRKVRFYEGRYVDEKIFGLLSEDI